MNDVVGEAIEEAFSRFEQAMFDRTRVFTAEAMAHPLLSSTAMNQAVFSLPPTVERFFPKSVDLGRREHEELFFAASYGFHLGRWAIAEESWPGIDPSAGLVEDLLRFAVDGANQTRVNEAMMRAERRDLLDPIAMHANETSLGARLGFSAVFPALTSLLGSGVLLAIAEYALGFTARPVESEPPGSPRFHRRRRYSDPAADPPASGSTRDYMDASNRATSPERLLEILDGTDDRLRRGVAANPVLPQEILLDLATEDDPTIREAVASNPALRDVETLRVLEGDPDIVIVGPGLARNPNVPPDVLDRLAQSGDDMTRTAAAGTRRVSDDRLVVLLRDPSPWVRASAVGDERVSAEQLQELANDNEPAVQRAVAAHPRTPPRALALLAHRPAAGGTVAGHPNAPADALRTLATYPDVSVKLAVAAHPNAPSDALDHLLLSDHPDVLEALRARGHGPADEPDESGRLKRRGPWRRR